jgi:hypothetical protein
MSNLMRDRFVPVRLTVGSSQRCIKEFDRAAGNLAIAVNVRPELATTAAG